MEREIETERENTTHQILDEGLPAKSIMMKCSFAPGCFHILKALMAIILKVQISYTEMYRNGKGFVFFQISNVGDEMF